MLFLLPETLHPGKTAFLGDGTVFTKGEESITSFPTRNLVIFSPEFSGRHGLVSRWHTLSHGERKRVQIGVALESAPDVLAVDEPTNHVDAGARALLAEALHAFSGIGLLVSHDRELLDTLCCQTIFLDPPEVTCRKGGYTRGKQMAGEEAAALRRKRESAKRKYHRLRREAGRRRDSANQADGRRSKKGISPKDHDAKQKIDGARLTGKDGVGGKLLRQLEGRLHQTREVMQEIRVKKENRLGISLPGAPHHHHGRAHQPHGPSLHRVPGGGALRLPLRPGAHQPRPEVPGKPDPNPMEYCPKV